MSTVTPMTAIALHTLSNKEEANEIALTYSISLRVERALKLVDERNALREELDRAREKLAAIKIHDHDMEDDTPVTLSFDEVWAMGESREKYHHNQTLEALAEVTKQRDALLLASRQLVPVEMTNVQQQLS